MHKRLSPRVDSPERRELLELGGRAQVPFLVDPSTGVRMYESADIIDYVASRYAQVEA